MIIFYAFLFFSFLLLYILYYFIVEVPDKSMVAYVSATMQRKEACFMAIPNQNEVKELLEVIIY